MKELIIAASLLASGFVLHAQSRQERYFTNTQFLSGVTAATPVRYRYRVYRLPDQTYGYIIFANDQKYLLQSSMPGKPDGAGFSTETDAGKVAAMVIKKLQLPAVPPRVSTIEMQHSGIH